MNIPLIPRKHLFGNPDRTMLRVSPDGEHIAWIAPDEGVLNVWVAPRQDPGAGRVITHDRVRGIRFYQWAYNSRQILYIQDQGGDENWRVYAAGIDGGAVRDLTPFEGVQARVDMTSPLYPDEAVIAINQRNPALHDLYRVDLRDGAMTLMEENPGFLNYILHTDFQVLGAAAMTPEGGLTLFNRPSGEWVPWDSIPPEDTVSSNSVGFDQNAEHMYLVDSRGRDTAALIEVRLADNTRRVLAENPLADVSEVLIHPTNNQIQAAAFTYDRKHWQVLDPSIAADLETLGRLSHGELQVLNRSLDDRFWAVAYILDDAPYQYYLYDRQTGQAEFIFTNRPALEGAPLAKMRSFVIDASDGLKLVGYYTLPLGCDSNDDGIPDQPMPMVLIPHGGPWGRDVWGFDSWHQWLANRGYVAMNVNFRSSTGLGKAFTNAGDKAWATDIIRDQYETVQWAIRQGIADPAAVGIMGGSFGGYSTLAGLTFYPETYACGVDIVGPSNLITLLESVPEYWKPMLDLLTTRVGDHRTEDGRALLKAHSPLTHAGSIRKPLLIAQGANDPRVKKAESDQIVSAMQAKGIPVAYVLFPDEGHGFARPENNLAFTAVAEAFLARCLEGRFEPIGADFEGSSLQVLSGAEQVPGLSTAIQHQP